MHKEITERALGVINAGQEGSLKWREIPTRGSRRSSHQDGFCRGRQHRHHVSSLAPRNVQCDSRDCPRRSNHRVTFATTHYHRCRGYGSKAIARKVVDSINRGQLAPHIGGVFNIDQAEEVHRLSSIRTLIGQLALRFASQVLPFDIVYQEKCNLTERSPEKNTYNLPPVISSKNSKRIKGVDYE